MIPPPWLDEFRADLDAEFARAPRIAAMATSDPVGGAAVRHVVVRRVEPDGSLLIATDARSAKVDHLRRRPGVSISFWLNDLRRQYRLDGPVDRIAESPERLALWRGLSDAARALFSWPEPGTLRTGDPDAFPAAVGADAEPPASFLVLRVRPTCVERLDLKPHPHERLRWWAVAGATTWTGPQAVNP
jgi:pyridoxamine 5'-phosphate oxidase